MDGIKKVLELTRIGIYGETSVASIFTYRPRETLPTNPGFLVHRAQNHPVLNLGNHSTSQNFLRSDHVGMWTTNASFFLWVPFKVSDSRTPFHHPRKIFVELDSTKSTESESTEFNHVGSESTNLCVGYSVFTHRSLCSDPRVKTLQAETKTWQKQ